MLFYLALEVNENDYHFQGSKKAVVGDLVFNTFDFGVDTKIHFMHYGIAFDVYFVPVLLIQIVILESNLSQ